VLQRDILEREREIWPAWAATLSGLENSIEKLRRKDEELANGRQDICCQQLYCFYVKILPGSFGSCMKLYHTVSTAIAANRKYNSPAGKKLKVLFVGGLSQRKGIANLFDSC
jgi:hypothetical protein